MSFPYAGGRGGVPVVAPDRASEAALAHADGEPLTWLLVIAGGDVEALETLLAMEAVRPGGARPEVLVELHRAWEAVRG